MLGDIAHGATALGGPRHPILGDAHEVAKLARLLEKLRAIEALFAGATTDGERVAAAEARKRIQLRLKVIEEADPPVEEIQGR